MEPLIQRKKRNHKKTKLSHGDNLNRKANAAYKRLKKGRDYYNNEDD